MSDRSDDDPRTSDEATGLPPLEELGDDEVLLVTTWVAGTGVARSPVTGELVVVRYLHVRGLAHSDETDPGSQPEWAQVHLAVPVEHAVDVAAALASGGMLDDDS